MQDFGIVDIQSGDIDSVEIFHHPDSEAMRDLADVLLITLNFEFSKLEEDCNCDVSISPIKRIENHIMHIDRLAIGLHYKGQPQDQRVIHFLVDSN